MVTTSQEQEEVAVNAVTVSERLSVIEANQRSILGEMRENARRQDQNHRDLSTKVDALDAKFDTKFDRLYFAIFATGAGVIVTLIGGIVTLVITQ